MGYITKRMVHNTVPSPRPAYSKVMRSCIKKKKYGTPEKAQSVIQSIIDTGNDTDPEHPLRPYKCDHCMYWHVGHDKRVEAQERKNG